MSDNNQKPQQFTFPKAEHLKSRKAIEQLFKSGRSFFVHPYKIFYSATPLQSVPTTSPEVVVKMPEYPVQVGFAVSTRNFKHAVDRNRIKRLGREAYRLNKHILLNGVNDKELLIHVFFVYTDKTLPTFENIQQKIILGLHKLVGIAEKNMGAKPTNKPA